MNLEPQTTYRTRRGREAYVFGKDPYCQNVWRGSIKPGVGCEWSGEGWVKGRGPMHEDTLIAKWKEKPHNVPPEWGLVEDPEARVELTWQCVFWNDWKDVVSVLGGVYAGKRVRECLYDDDRWRWFRRPVKPKEWWLIQRDGDVAIAYAQEHTARHEYDLIKNARGKIIHVHEVLPT